MRDKGKKFFLLSSSIKVPENFCPVIVGKICSAYGVLGWLKIISFTEKLYNIINYQPWFVNVFSQWRCVYLKDWQKYHNGFHFIVKIQEIYDRDVAELLNNHKIYVDVLQFPNLSKGEYYWKDIIGFQVIGVFGYQFGVVVDLIETGSNDVLVVKNKDQTSVINRVYLIPFIINKVIRNVNCIDHIINVDWDS